MVALDTNILLRFILNDDPVQSPRARELVATNQVYVPLTVILEFAWALRRIYKYTRSEVTQAILAFVNIGGVTVEASDRVDFAIERAKTGVDFADALHLASSASTDWLATFDKQFVKSCADTNPPVRHP